MFSGNPFSLVNPSSCTYSWDLVDPLLYNNQDSNHSPRRSPLEIGSLAHNSDELFPSVKLSSQASADNKRTSIFRSPSLGLTDAFDQTGVAKSSDLFNLDSSAISLGLSGPASFIDHFGVESAPPLDSQIDMRTMSTTFLSPVLSLCTSELVDGFEHAFKPDSTGMMTVLAGTSTIERADSSSSLEHFDDATFESTPSRYANMTITRDVDAAMLSNHYARTMGVISASCETTPLWKGVTLAHVRELEQRLRLESKDCHLPQDFLMQFIGRVDPNGHSQNAWRCYVAGCEKECIRRDHALDHVRMHLDDRGWVCDLCPKSFLRSHDLKRHRETHETAKTWQCNTGCGRAFTRKDLLCRHMENSCPVLKNTHKIRVKKFGYSSHTKIRPCVSPRKQECKEDQADLKLASPAGSARPIPPVETLPAWVAAFQNALANLHYEDVGKVRIKPGRKSETM